MYDLKTGFETQITTDPLTQERAAIFGDRIVWEDSRNGRENTDIYMYDLTTGIETRITNDPAHQQSPVIFGNRIVWQDNRDGNSDIYMYTLSTSSAAVTIKILSDDSWYSYNSYQECWEIPDFDDSVWRNAYAPYPYLPDYPPTYHISDTNAVYMWDYPDYPPKLPDGKDGPNQSWFRKIFDLSSDTWDLVSATVVVGADDDFDFYVNGELVHSDWDGKVWSGPFTVDIKPYLVKGKNVFAMYAMDSYELWEWALVDATIEIRAPYYFGDLDEDGCIDRTDLHILLTYIRGRGHYDQSYDLNDDGKVNITDARKLVLLFTNSGGTP